MSGAEQRKQVTAGRRTFSSQASSRKRIVAGSSVTTGRAGYQYSDQRVTLNGEGRAVMKQVVFTAVLVVILTSEATVPAADRQSQADEIEALVWQLGDARFRVREAAVRTLV